MKQFIPSWLEKLIFKATLERLSVDQLRRKMIALQLAEKRVCAEIEKGEKIKTKLFEDGSRAPSDLQRLQAAHKFEAMDRKLKSLQQNWLRNLKNQRVIEGLLEMKAHDNQNVVEDFGLNAEEIAVTVQEKKVKQELASQTTNEIIEAFDDSLDSESSSEISEGVRSVMERMVEAGEKTFQDKAFEGAHQAHNAHQNRSHVFSEDRG
jgi:hypothetical protein